MFNSWVRKTPWRRKWQPTPAFLPGKSHGQRSLAGCSRLGHRESGWPEAAERGCMPVWICKAVSGVFFPWWINQVWRGKQDIVPVSPPNLELAHSFTKGDGAYRGPASLCEERLTMLAMLFVCLGRVFSRGIRCYFCLPSAVRGLSTCRCLRTVCSVND